MVTRRNFLGLGLAGVALPLVSGSAAASLAQGKIFPGGLAERGLYKAVFDRGFAASVVFGDTLAALDVPVAGITGDITALWFNDLDPRWRQGAVAVSGLTASGPLFCMEQMMGQYGLRLAFRGEHAYQADGAIRHRLSGDPAVLQLAPALANSGPEWPRYLATLLGGARTRVTVPEQIEVFTPRATPTNSAALTLHSWLLAPVERA